MTLDSFTRYLSMLQSCACAALMWGSVLFAARRFARRFLPDEILSVQFAATGVITLGLIVLIVQFMGLCGALVRWPICGVCLLIAAIGLVSGAGAKGRSDSQFIVEWLRRRVNDGYALTACVVAVIVFQAITRALRCPPLSWDSLTYHAFLPARWVQLGAISPFAAPGGMDGYRALPWNLELVTAFFALPFGNDLLLNLVNPPLVLLTGIGAYALVRHFGVGERIALWAPLLFCFSPAYWSLVTTQYNDILATMTGLAGVLFLCRHGRTGRSADLILSALAIGLACGTKYTALPVAFVCAAIATARATFAGSSRGRALLRLAMCGVLAGSVGAYRYIENWATLGNPLYPVQVSVAGHTFFEGSPMQAELIASSAASPRAAEWDVVRFLCSTRPFSWGPKFWALAVIAAWFLMKSLQARRSRADALVIAAILGVVLAAQFGPREGLAELTRRAFTDSFCRMMALPMALIACLAVAAMGQWRWPRGLPAAIPALALVWDAVQGKYPQPPSINEIICVVAVTLVGCLLLARPVSTNVSQVLYRARPAIALTIVLIIPLCADALRQKRDHSRYVQYAHGIDFHDIPRELASAWRACDEPAVPHVVAYVRRHKPDETESMHHINTRWFFYPLLGSHWQNRVVYASLFEPTDLPSRPYFAALRSDVRRDAWFENLHRLRVDRMLVVHGAEPEETWIRQRPSAFVRLDHNDAYDLYRVNQNTLTDDGRRFVSSDGADAD